MDIRIRKLKKIEIPEVTKLIVELFPEANFIIETNDLILVAEFSGKIVGFSHIRFMENRIILKGIGVGKKYQRRGIGKKILEKTIVSLEKKGLPVYLKVKNSNDIAIGLYSKEGFVGKKYGNVLVMVRLPVN